MPPSFAPIGWNILRGISAAIAVVLAVGVSGCGDQASISQYEVAKEKTPTALAKEPSHETSANSMAWFFKLEGPPERVSDIEPQFTAVVESVRFENEKPKWSLPEGWSETAGSQMRFATLTVDGVDPPLEVSVIPLPVFGGGDISEYVRQNIDRWRRQIGLEPMAGDDWLKTAKAAGEVHESSAGAVPVTFVDLNGKTEKFDPARMLGAVLIPETESASVARSPAPSTAVASRPASRSSSPLTFETPEGWEPGKASAMRAASFLVADGDQKVDVSAMKAGGDELSNVNRWRGQVGLQPVSEEELEDTVREIDVDGTTGRMFELVGETETILAVIVPSGGQSWFFKLMGDPALAEREKAKFEQFVTSVKLR